MITSLIDKKVTFNLGNDERVAVIVGVDKDSIGWSCLLQAENGDLISRDASNLTVVNAKPGKRNQAPVIDD
jgi:hypothetical protein